MTFTLLFGLINSGCDVNAFMRCICRQHRHTDWALSCATVGKFGSHSLFAGVGALYVRRRPRVRLEAPQSGGGQERGMRSGTVPTPLVVGLGAACELASKEMEVCRESCGG